MFTHLTVLIKACHFIYLYLKCIVYYWNQTLNLCLPFQDPLWLRKFVFDVVKCIGKKSTYYLFPNRNKISNPNHGQFKT